MSDTWLQWILSIGKDVILAAAVWLLWLLRNALIVGWNIQKFISRFEEHERKFEEYAKIADNEVMDLKRRLGQAGEAMSDLASDVQGLPERMRGEFLPRRESDLINAESKVDRERLWQETRDLWKVTNRREDEKGGRR